MRQLRDANFSFNKSTKFSKESIHNQFCCNLDRIRLGGTFFNFFFAYILLKVCLAIFKRVTPWPGCLYLCSNNKKSLQRGCIAMQQSNILNCFSFERARGGTTLKNQGDALLDESLYFCSLQQFCKLGTYMWYIQCVSPRGTIFTTENGYIHVDKLQPKVD